ncbi:hypothetical protein ACFL31_00945 [Candidatus Margulisiibacteriota bacterium]
MARTIAALTRGFDRVLSSVSQGRLKLRYVDTSTRAPALGPSREYNFNSEHGTPMQAHRKQQEALGTFIKSLNLYLIDPIWSWLSNESQQAFVDLLKSDGALTSFFLEGLSHPQSRRIFLEKLRASTNRRPTSTLLMKLQRARADLIKSLDPAVIEMIWTVLSDESQQALAVVLKSDSELTAFFRRGLSKPTDRRTFQEKLKNATG